jgi:alpha-D-ribose 1-methylphosphonate 5-phosphate C-P lyase
MSRRKGFEYGLLDIAAKKEIWRSCLKALAVPGYQVPFSSREMPIARGFGTGGLQISLSLAAPGDVLKVIDQGADECVNACSIRELVAKVSPGVTTTTSTPEATIIQTRHRIPETPLEKGQILVFQVPFPDSLGFVEPYEMRRVEMHGEEDYSRLYVVLYENVVAYGEIQISSDYPTQIHDRYVMDPSPIPRWDVPQIQGSRGILLYGAGREKKIYAVPPFTSAIPLDFEDVRFSVEGFKGLEGQRFRCSKCGATNTFLDEFFDLDGRKHHACSDTEFCERNQAATVGGAR